MPPQFTISTDKSKLNIDIIHDYLSNHSYWAKGRSRADVQLSIDNSLCFGLYADSNMIGFARVLSDQVVFAYLMDVFVLDDYREQGLGKLLVGHIMAFPTLQVRRWMLGTFYSHSFYEQFGFHEMLRPDRFMEKIDAKRL